MTKWIRIWCVIAMCIFGGLPATSFAQPIEQKHVSNVFLDTDLREALREIGLQVGVTVLAGVDVEGTVTLELDDVPLSKALDMMLAPGGFVWQKHDDYILVGPATADSPLFVGLSETKQFKLTHIKAEAAMNLLSPKLREYCMDDPDSNRITVTAPRQVVQRVQEDLAGIDVPAKHVLLEARVIVLERESLLDLGVNWDFPTLEVGTVNTDALNRSFPLVVSVGMTPGGVFTDSLMMSLNFLESNEEATEVAHPQLTVRDGQPADMGVLTEEYFQIESRDNIDLEVIPSGTKLTILPQIGDDGKVTLEIEIEVSEVVGRGDKNLPVVTRRTAKTTVQVASGGTAAIAGLSDTRTDVLNTGVPGAKGLPLLGGAFKNNTASKTNKQLAVFITPTVLEDSTQSAKDEFEMPRPTVDEQAFRAELQQAIDRANMKGAGA